VPVPRELVDDWAGALSVIGKLLFKSYSNASFLRQVFPVPWCVVETNDVGRQRRGPLSPSCERERDTAMVLRAVLDGRRDAWTFWATYLSDGAPAGACSEPPHGAPREITDSENSEAGHAVGIAAP
jgi:hypothetical protein